MTKRWPNFVDIRAVALLISYAGELPAEKLRNMMNRLGHTGRAKRADGSALGSNPGVYARRCISYLKSEGLVSSEGEGKAAMVRAAVPLAELAAWLADALEEREEHGIKDPPGLYTEVDVP